MGNTKTFFLGFFFFLIASPSVFSQTYVIDDYNGQTVNTCGGTFVDSGNGGFGDYDNNENYEVTFCSGSGDYLRFLVNPNETSDAYQIQAGDTLFVYDGTGTAGTLLASYSAGEDPGANIVVFESASNCTTFNFVSNASSDGNGWEIEIECIPSGCGSGNNPAPADNFADAPYVCNFDGYCATTTGYTEDEPFNFVGGGNCPVIFGGTIQNNSWLAFEATGPNISFQIDVIGCYGFGYEPNPTVINYGIQAAILAFDGSNFTRISDCNLSDGQQLSFALNNTTALVTGDTYYLTIDGSAGSDCDYSINVTGDVQVVDAGADQSICNGNSATLTASGPTGSTYSWEAVGGGFGPVTGNPVTVSPTTTTEYIVEVTSPGGCSSQTDIVEVTVNTCSCSIDGITGANQTACAPASNTYTQEVVISYTSEPGSGTLDVNGQSFGITSSPQTVLLTNLSADGNAVDVTANFSDLPSCTMTVNSLFIAPASCGCLIDRTTAESQTVCDPASNTYTQEIMISYTDNPGSGTLNVNGQAFGITGSPQTVILTGLVADGNAVDVTVSFSALPSCAMTSNNLFTAPASCSVICAPDNGTWD